MRQNLRSLAVEELIVHDIPSKMSARKLKEDSQIQSESPTYSETPSPVNESVVNFFHDKIIETIGSNKAFDVMFDLDSSSPVKELISDYFDSTVAKRIDISRSVSEHLYNIQNAQNSSGLLLFVKSTINQSIVLSVLKVEREDGVRVRQIQQNNQRTFDIEHIRDLMLTKKTKLFKIVMFYLDGNVVKGILCDQQRGYNNNRDIAEFFLSKFLGCRLVDEPPVLTKQFFSLTQQFINECMESPEEKGAMINHLFSEMTSLSSTISPVAFARKTLTADKIDTYLQFLKENDGSISDFDKSCTLIEARLKQIQYKFVSGITVYGTQDALKEKSSIIELEDGGHRFEINDEIKQVHTK